MNRAPLITIAIVASLIDNAVAQEFSIFPKGEKSANTHNTGTVWLHELAASDSIFNYSTAFATFAAGAKLDWHLHPGGQILMVTEGVGFYQERGEPIQIVRKGDVIKCRPNVVHWHGATPSGHFSYIATSPTQKGKTKWLERVTDEAYGSTNVPIADAAKPQDEIIALSKRKWLWMADKNVYSLGTLFDEKSVFVHMGGTWGKSNELEVIKSGSIWYKKAEVYSASVNVFGNTAILLSDIDLVAVVGGNEVTNPFMVTEVYLKENGQWKMGSLTFSRLMRPVKLMGNIK